jgi:CBS domain-containing protein
MNTIQQLSVERRMKLMPCTVRPSDSVAHARALLEERRISHLPVVSKERLVGIVSSRDLRSTRHAAMPRAIAKALELRPDCVKVRSVMTTCVHTAKPSDDLAYAARLMQAKHVGMLPVIEQGHLVGVINRLDIVDGVPLTESTKCKSDSVRNRRSGWQKRRIARALGSKVDSVSAIKLAH